jgi:hypothetical protein
MPEAAGRFLYFLFHPSEYIGLWSLDLTVVTLVFAAATLIVVLVQLRLMTQQTGLMTQQTALMNHQDNLMQRQTDIVVRQDETNREVLARRIKLVMYTKIESASQVVVLCRNDGKRTARDFYWHLAVPETMAGDAVWNGLGNAQLFPTSGGLHDEHRYRHHSQLVTEPLYPTRATPVARISGRYEQLSLWWSTQSEDGSDPTPDGEMQRMNESA